MKGFWKNARQYKSELLGRMFGVTAFAAESEPEGTALPAGSNVLGVGFGAKVAAGAAVAGETAVRIYVRAEVPAASLPESEVIPGEVNGVPTDVVQWATWRRSRGLPSVACRALRDYDGHLGVLGEASGLQ
jgi:hypothetical protein